MTSPVRSVSELLGSGMSVLERNIFVRDFARPGNVSLTLFFAGACSGFELPFSRKPSSTRSRATISVRYFFSPLRRSSQLEV